MLDDAILDAAVTRAQTDRAERGESPNQLRREHGVGQPRVEPATQVEPQAVEWRALGLGLAARSILDAHPSERRPRTTAVFREVVAQVGLVPAAAKPRDRPAPTSGTSGYRASSSHWNRRSVEADRNRATQIVSIAIHSCMRASARCS